MIQVGQTIRIRGILKDSEWKIIDKSFFVGIQHFRLIRCDGPYETKTLSVFAIEEILKSPTSPTTPRHIYEKIL